MRNYSFSFLFGRFDDFMMSSLFGFLLHTTPHRNQILQFLFYLIYLQLKWFQRTIFGQLLFLMDELDGIILKKSKKFVFKCDPNEAFCFINKTDFRGGQMLLRWWWNHYSFRYNVWHNIEKYI